MNDDVSCNEKNCVDEQDVLGGTGNELGDGLINQMVSENGICDETTEEEISCRKTDVDQSPIYVSTPGLVSVYEIMSGDCFSKNEERILISDAEISGNAHSKDAAFTDRNEAEKVISNKDSHQDLMGVEPLTINMPPSTVECMEQYIVPPQNGTNGLNTDMLVLSNKADGNSLSNKVSLSKSVPLESKVISVAETSGVVNDNENELENETAGAAKSLYSTDHVMTLDENCEDSTNDSTDLHDVEAVQRIKSLNSESSRNHPSMLWSQKPVGVAALETNSCKEPSIDKPSICELKRSAEDGDYENELMFTKKGKLDELGIQVEVVSSCNSTAVAKGTVSDITVPSSSPMLEKHHTDVDIASSNG